MKQLKKEFTRLKPNERLYGFDRPVVALTGGIATGKSTASAMLKDAGLKVIDADQLVKSIYASEDAQQFIQKEIPPAWQNNTIHFPTLRKIVFENLEYKTRVENFIYQRLPEAFKAAACSMTSQDFLLYDVPLLFEKNLDKKVDLSILVYAPKETQLERLIKRDQNPKDLAEKIITQQMSIEEKKKLADLVIQNNGSYEDLAAEVQKLLLQILI
jgi:dephospho-CoA kinase